MNKALIVAVALVAAAPVPRSERCASRSDVLLRLPRNDRNALGVPILHGQTSDAIVAAMQEYRTGQRPATVMDRIAKGFTDEESRAIAAWIAHQP